MIAIFLFSVYRNSSSSSRRFFNTSSKLLFRIVSGSRLSKLIEIRIRIIEAKINNNFFNKKKISKTPDDRNNDYWKIFQLISLLLGVIAKFFSKVITFHFIFTLSLEESFDIYQNHDISSTHLSTAKPASLAETRKRNFLSNFIRQSSTFRPIRPYTRR